MENRRGYRDDMLLFHAIIQKNINFLRRSSKKYDFIIENIFEEVNIIDDIKIRRWIESGELKEGDLVIVEYEGEISSNYEVKGAYSIFTGTLEENGILNQE